MARKPGCSGSIAASLAALVCAGLVGCRTPTRVVGALKPMLGESGDVRGSVVELYAEQDLSEPAQYEVRPDTGGRSDWARFEFSDVVPGTYYVVAWQDINQDELVDDGDFVGVRGGEYRARYGGQPLSVALGSTADAGEVQMAVLREPIQSASGERTGGGTVTDFSYVCYHDLTLTSLTITFPGLGTMVDPLAPGTKVGGQTYTSVGWEAGGAEMPAGEHVLAFRGTMDGKQFDVELKVVVD